MKKDQKTLFMAISEIIDGDPTLEKERVVEEASRMADRVAALHLDDEEKEELVLRVGCRLLGARRLSPQEAIAAALYLYDLVEKEEEH